MHSFFLSFGIGEADDVEHHADLRLVSGRRLESAKRIERPDSQVVDQEIGLLGLKGIKDFLQVRRSREQLEIDADLAKSPIFLGRRILDYRDAPEVALDGRLDHVLEFRARKIGRGALEEKPASVLRA